MTHNRLWVALVALFLATGCESKQDAPMAAATTMPAPAPASASVPEEDPATPVALVNREKEEIEKEIQKYRVSEDLNQLPAMPEVRGERYPYTWQETVAQYLKYLAREPRTYSGEDDLRRLPEVIARSQVAKQWARNEKREVMVAYGFLGLGNGSAPVDRIAKVAPSIFSNPVTRELAYRATLPSLRSALQQMHREDRADYLTILRHTSSYMATFNQAREEKYLKSLAHTNCLSEEWEKKYYTLPSWMVSGPYPCITLFTQHGPDGKVNPYRKAEAFVYRRVQEGWDLSLMRATLDRLISDLQ